MSEFQVDPGELERAGATLANIASVLGSQQLSDASGASTGHDDLARALTDCVRNWTEAWEIQRTRLGTHSVTATEAATRYRAADSQVARALPGSNPRGGVR